MSQLLSSPPQGATDALIVFVATLLIGIIVDQLLYRSINSRAAQKGWATGRQLASGLHGLPTIGGLILGTHLALLRLNLPTDVQNAVVTALKVLAIFAATAFAARILSRIVRMYTEREGSRLPSTSIFVNLARGLVWVFGLISLLSALGVSIAPLITALGVGGLAVGLALQPTLENIFSGIQVLASRQIEPGDLIRLETGEEGSVLDVTWRNTTILTPRNDVVIIPNSILGRSRITNYSALDGEHVLAVPLTVPASSDLAVVEQCANQAAEKIVQTVDGVVAGVEPSVRFAGIVPAGVQVNVSIRVENYSARILVRHEFVKEVSARFTEAGIEGLTAPAAPAPAPTSQL